MAFQSEFTPLALSDLHREAAVLKTEGWRFIQTHAVKCDEGVDLYYSFMKDGRIVNYRVEGVTNEPVPSITDLFLAAFVFENEARELFGVDMRDIAIDFAGAMYAPAIDEPMTIITPEQKAAKEKAMKAAAAKAAKTAEGRGTRAETADSKPAKIGFVMTPERWARLNAKLPTMSPEKVAKVEAALKAKGIDMNGGDPSASPQNDTVGAAQDDMSKDTGSPVEAQPTRPAEAEASETGDAPTPDATATPEISQPADRQLETLLSLMDADKAETVRAAISKKGGE